MMEMRQESDNGRDQMMGMGQGSDDGGWVRDQMMEGGSGIR